MGSIAPHFAINSVMKKNTTPDANITVTTWDSLVIRDAGTKEVLLKQRGSSSNKPKGYFHAGQRKK